MTVTELRDRFAYPGRYMIFGKYHGEFFAAYGVTARSAASRAKKYVYDEARKIAYVEPTDPDIMAQGDVTLLDYTAAKIFNNGLLLSNGRQSDAFDSLETDQLNSYIHDGFKQFEYEHDAYATPRISLFVKKEQDSIEAACAHIYRGENEESMRVIHHIDLNDIKENSFYFLPTYNGPNVRPTPAFTENPLLITIGEDELQENLEQFLDHLFAPHDEVDDLRVSTIVTQFSNDAGWNPSISILNATI